MTRASRSSSAPRMIFSAGARKPSDRSRAAPDPTRNLDVDGPRPAHSVSDAFAPAPEAGDPRRDPPDPVPGIAGSDGRRHRAAPDHHRPERRQPLRMGRYGLLADIDHHGAHL